MEITISTTWEDLGGHVMVLERQLLRLHLEAAEWSITGAADSLGLTPGGLRRALERRHPELEAERRAKGPGRGRPKSPELRAG